MSSSRLSRPMILLAFDTATDAASVALVAAGTALGERPTTAARVLADAERLIEEAGLGPGAVERIAVGTGPGRYTSLRMGLVTARTLSFALGAPVAGVSTLATLAAGAGGALPVIDARRGEVFTLVDGQPGCLAPDGLTLPVGTVCVGDGAVRYREIVEAAGAIVPDDADPRHRPSATVLAGIASAFGPAELAEPLYLRAPDADRALARRPRP